MQDLDIKLVKDQSAGRCKRGYRENQLLFCKSHLFAKATWLTARS